ncbi:MAG: Putative methyltransferase [Thermacetogenium phaeum]|uniref:Putative methyltransferase n=1 Tax=Thermacetogenium phaeum TaxID=85874 RepID=A0A101FH57_9THEO|nr:MAG: Putative methyltransferase [Thermacetogenium phaeum]
MEIDWATVWHQKHEECFWTKRLRKKGITNETYWDNYPDELCSGHECRNYPGAILEKMKPYLGRESRVLDIGAGDGAYAVPLARIVKEVTVVEPSQGQIRRLLKRAEGLENIRVINKRWEDVSREELQEYDLVNAAYCFAMPDIKDALIKMWDCTKGLLFLVTQAGSSLAAVYSLFVPDYEPPPDYIYLYNVVYQLGIKANVEINTRRYLYPWHLLVKAWRYDEMITPEDEEKARAFLEAEGKLVTKKDGTLWVKCWYRDAVIYAEKA